MLNVLVVDDHLLVAQAVGGLLSELCDLNLDGVCGSARQALLVLEQARPDLLVQDLHLPGESWESVAQMFLRRNSAGKVLILTALADGFVPPTWLSPSLLGVVDKSRAWNDLIGLVGGWRHELLAGRPTSQNRCTLPVLALLSPREQRVFLCLGQGLLNREVATALGLSVGTVESYRKAICSKLGISGSELVRLAVLHRCLPDPDPCPAAA
jgi:two-component system invasion response regulator UvrY